MIHPFAFKTQFVVRFFLLLLACYPLAGFAEVPDPLFEPKFKTALDDALTHETYWFIYDAHGTERKFYVDFGLGFEPARAARPGEAFKKFLADKVVYLDKTPAEVKNSNHAEFKAYLPFPGTNDLLGPEFSFSVHEIIRDQDDATKLTDKELSRVKLEVIRLMGNLKNSLDQGMRSIKSLGEAIDNIEANKDEFIHTQCFGKVAIYRQRIGMLRALHGKQVFEIMEATNTTHKLKYIRENIHASLQGVSDEILLSVLAEKKL
jgi:hypothetical protein